MRAAPAGARALNLAFDVTPSDLVTAIVTEDRVIRPRAPGAWLTPSPTPSWRLGRQVVAAGLVVAAGGNLAARRPGPTAPR